MSLDDTQEPDEFVLTRWSIIVRDYVGSDTLRGMSGDGEMLFLRLCLDQWARGAARPDKTLWRRAHGGRCHDFEAAWDEATAVFQLTPQGLVHARVAADRAEALRQIEAKVRGAARTNALRAEAAKASRDAERDGERTHSARSANAQRNGERTVTGSSASASASASASQTGVKQQQPLDQGAHPERKPPTAAAARVPREPSGRVQEFIHEWKAAWERHTGEEYVLHDSEGKQTADFAKRAQRVTRAQFARNAQILIECEGDEHVDPFWVTNRNLRTLCSRFADVGSIPRQSAARRQAKAPPKSFAQESFENLIGTSPTINPEGAALAAASIARPDRQPPGTLAGRVAEHANARPELLAIPREAGQRAGQHPL